MKAMGAWTSCDQAQPLGRQHELTWYACLSRHWLVIHKLLETCNDKPAVVHPKEASKVPSAVHAATCNAPACVASSFVPRMCIQRHAMRLHASVLPFFHERKNCSIPRMKCACAHRVERRRDQDVGGRQQLVDVCAAHAHTRSALLHGCATLHSFAEMGTQDITFPLTACTCGCSQPMWCADQSGSELTVVWPLLLVRGDVLAAAAREEALQAQAILRAHVRARTSASFIVLLHLCRRVRYAVK